MAATVTSAWAKPGAWALDSEEHEEELKQEQTPAATANGRGTAAPMSDFPDLMTAAATKTKKKKGQTLSLGEFVSKPTTGQTYQAAKGLTAEDMMMLPTGPRQRSAEELDRTRLGGGFRSYGGGGDRNNDSSNSRWGSGRSNGIGGGDEGRKPSREPLGPSRADEIDDWGAAKKSTIGGGGGFDRRERGGGFFEGSHSRADESDSWASNKSYAPPSRNGGGFDRERRMGFESSGDADTSDNWGKKKEVRFVGGGGGGSAFDSLRERRVGNDSSDSDNWGKKREEVSGVGGGGRPKLNLQPRKVGVVGDDESVVAVKPVTKGSNPFGDARPREQVLKEKGEDWKEMDEKLEAMKIKDLGDHRLKRGGGIGRPRSNEDSTERNWRKNQAVDVPNPPPSDEKNENGHVEEAAEEEKQTSEDK